MVKRFHNAEFFIDNDLPLHVSRGEGMQGDYLVHGHDFSELTVILGGYAEHVVDGCAYPIRRGDVWVLHPRTSHGYQAMKEFVLVNIKYKRELLSDLLDLHSLSGYQALFQVGPRIRKQYPERSAMRLADSGMAAIERLISRLEDEFAGHAGGRNFALRNLFHCLLIHLSRAYGEADRQADQRIRRLAEAISFMETNYSSHIAVADMAASVGLSERQFTRIFKEVFTCTPLAYIIRLRLRKAARLLQRYYGQTTNSDDQSQVESIADIAWQCGFSDHTYFSRCFRQATGMSPREYRCTGHWFPKL